MAAALKIIEATVISLLDRIDAWKQDGEGIEASLRNSNFTPLIY